MKGQTNFADTFVFSVPFFIYVEIFSNVTGMFGHGVLQTYQSS